MILTTECEKSFREIIDEMDRKDEEDMYEPEELALQQMEKLGFPIEPEDEALMEQKFLLYLLCFDRFKFINIKEFGLNRGLKKIIMIPIIIARIMTPMNKICFIFLIVLLLFLILIIKTKCL